MEYKQEKSNLIDGGQVAFDGIIFKYLQMF